MMKYINIITTILFFILPTGCITEYEPSNLNTINALLVVDGTITNNDTYIKLSYTVGVKDNLQGGEYILNAGVYVECDNETSFGPGEYVGNGTYKITTGILIPDAKYRLVLNIDGKQYLSEYLNPIETSEIENLAWEKKSQGSPVNINLSTSDPKDQTKYYKWKYNEVWEVQAELFATVGMSVDIWGNSTYYDYSINGDNIYYCWVTDSSKVILLGNTENLVENKVLKQLMERPPSDERWSVLYYISVQQNQLRKEAYDYFYNMQKFVEQTGGLFSSMPMELTGSNISNVSDPDEKIIGYIDVSTTTRKDMYIPLLDNLYEPLLTNCEEESSFSPDGNVILYTQDGKYAPPYCVDCRKKENATKNRPSFWPDNGHY